MLALNNHFGFNCVPICGTVRRIHNDARTIMDCPICGQATDGKISCRQCRAAIQKMPAWIDNDPDPRHVGPLPCVLCDDEMDRWDARDTSIVDNSYWHEAHCLGCDREWHYCTDCWPWRLCPACGGTARLTKDVEEDRQKYLNETGFLPMR
jgi:hypothetical protein